MLRELIRKISSYPITFESWILTLLGIIFVRIFLEQYSNNIANHFVLIDPSTIIQYAASFIAILLWCTAIVLIFSKKPLREVAVLTLSAFMIIWTPPIIDLILSGGKGFGIHYLFLPAKELFLAFITGFWSTTSNGMTYGIRIEIIISIVACFTFIYMYTKSILKSFNAAIIMYFGIFFVISIPSFLGLFQDSTIPRFIQDSIMHSNIINNSTFSIKLLGIERLFEIGFNSLMIQVNLVIALIALTLICAFGYKEKALILLKNARPERITHYAALVILGVMFGGEISFFNSWINILSLVMTVIAFAFAWMAAVCVNDIHDEDIDMISNKSRPIPSGKFNKNEFYTISRIFLLISLLSAYGASLYGLFFVILYSFVYYIYSAWPLKLKRHYLGGIFVIGVASISAFYSGFFLAGDSRELFTLPPLLILALGLLFGLGSMIKDLKDYEGDKAHGIQTLPVAIGLRTSKIVIASILSIALIGISIYFMQRLLIFSSLIASILIWRVLLAKIYREKNFFIVYIAFLVICVVVFVMR